MKTNPLKKAALLAVFVCASAFSLTACQKEQKADQSKAPLPVLVTSIQTQDLPVWDSYTGRVSAVQKAVVVARAGGTVQAIYFQQGGQVVQNQPLFQIDPAPYQAAVDRAQAAYDNSKGIYERLQKLYESKGVSAQTLDSAKAKAMADKAQLQTAQINLAYTKVQAPISGVISRAYVTVGQLVSPQAASVMATIVNPSQMYVDFSESSEQLFHYEQLIQKGVMVPDVKIQLVRNGQVLPLSGKLIVKGHEVNPMTGQVSLRTLFANPNGQLLDGMAITVRYQQGFYHNVIAVPAQSVLIENTPEGVNHYVFVVNKDKKIIKRIVQVGEMVGQKVIVTQGLSVGEEIVVEGVNKVHPNETVEPRKAN